MPHVQRSRSGRRPPLPRGLVDRTCTPLEQHDAGLLPIVWNQAPARSRRVLRTVWVVGDPFCWIIPDLLRSYDVRFTGIEDWGRLFGLIFTPLGIVRTLNRTNFALQLLRNLTGLIVGIDAKIPSAALEEVIRSGMDSPRSPHASARRAPKPLGSGKSGTDRHRAASRVSVGPSSTRPQIIISVAIWRTAESQGTAAIMRNTMAAGNLWRRTCDL